MGGTHSSLFEMCKKIIATMCLFVTVFSTFSAALINVRPHVAEAAQVAVDTAVNITSVSHLQSGSQTVFTDDQTGYKFYRDGGGGCVYSKTTDAGASWGSAVQIDSQTDCAQVSVWYDRWTPGDTGNTIHIATYDTSSNNDNIFYNALDTTSDTRLTGAAAINTDPGNVQTYTLAGGANMVSITKATDGTIFVAIDDSTDSAVLRCSTSCGTGTNWSEAGTRPQDLANDYSILVPLASGNVMIINRDISLEDIRSKVWNGSAWSGTWTTIDANATDNTTYDGGIAATVSSTTPGVVYLAYLDHATLGATNDVRTAKYNGSVWSLTTAVISNSATRAITGVAIGIDAANDDVFVAYSARTTAGTPTTGNVYWKKATSSMGVWSQEYGPVNTSGADNIYGVDINLASDERILTTWYEATEDYVYADTLEDIFPGIHASTTGNQTTSVNASTSNFYVDGKFLLYNTYKPLDVTGVTITENGTIDGSTNIANVKLFYETDTTAPYNCESVSYGGTESQFGSTDTNGFSGADGTSAFTGTTVTVSTTTALCVYVVMDVLDNTPSGSTIDISIANPSIDVTVTRATAGPVDTQNIIGTTNVLNDQPTQIHFHWRNDDGSESTATSKTGGAEDTTLGALQIGAPARLRLEVSNEGGSSTPSMQYRLEYATSTGVCTDISTWNDVGATGGAFDMYDSPNLTNGNNTTNIAVASGGVTNENTTFLTPNGGVRDTTSQTGGLVLTSTNYVELEYSIAPTLSASEGTTFCFRVTDAGAPLYSYSAYPTLTINADVKVDIFASSQTTATTVPATNFYVGSGFSITENSSSRNVTSIMLSESGTVDAQVGLDNIKLYYDLDTSAPYNCASESFAITDSQFGSTDTDGFAGPNGTSTFTGSVPISTTATMCVYVVLDVTKFAQNNETINVLIANPSTDVVVSGGGSVAPTAPKDLNGETTLTGPILTQTHYHWRNDNGSEALATSLSGGSEDTPVVNIAEATPVRLRVQVSNEGLATSTEFAPRIEYGAKITTCNAVSAWVDVGDIGGAFDMYDSANITDGNNTTDITVATGGVTNENTTFKTPNSAVKDTSSQVATTTLTPTEFMEMEYSIVTTNDAGFDVDYCFRVTNAGTALNVYSQYGELSTAPERDFKVQRNNITMTGVTQTITAGVDYVAPAASTSAFIRITNSHHTGAGSTGAGATQNADDVTVYIENPSNITSSITFRRPAAATGNTRVWWEIVEFIGTPGSDNEMIVRSQTAVTYGAAATVATGTAASVTDDTDVVVFITGQLNPLANATGYNTGQSTSVWNASSNEPVFTRGSASTNAVIVSYAVVEFTGPNWIVQRSEHTYTSAGVTETESITPVNSLARTFLHTQKRINSGLTGVDEFGHEVWLSGVGQISYFLESGATTPSGQTSVAWVIENIQITSGAMNVQRKNNSSNGGTGPLTISVTLDTALDDTANASLFVNTRAAGTGTNHPRAIVGATIVSTTAFELWRSNTGSNMTYRAEVVEWPTAGLAMRQNYYRFYVDNDALDPTDPWPVGGTDLGENTVLTGADEPLGEGDRIRIRMTLQAVNATLPQGTRAYKLQYGQMNTTCSAIPEANWVTLGDSASSTIWRGFDAPSLADETVLSGDPPTGGALNISVSDVAGTYEESSDTAVNPYAVQENEDIEYDWIVEQNGASGETYYCFRMINADGDALSLYNNYPQIRTASFTPRTQNWRWYDDETNETPVTPLANENVAPINIANTQTLKLRVTVKEIENISRDNVRFKLQYSEYADFATSTDVVATSTCNATSTWCYADGGGVDNVKITTKTLSDANACAASVGNGCGTHNETPEVKTGFRHNSSAAAEYEFTIQSASPRVNRVYYFRLYDLVQNVPVPTNSGESYPSLVTEGASLEFTMEGVGAGTLVEGVTTDIATTPTTLSFGVLTSDIPLEGAHRLAVDTNGTDGYQLFMTMSQDLQNYTGATIDPISGTNVSPVAWATGCNVSATGCFGYHTSDDTLQGGSTRFSAVDTYARVSTTTLDEISFSSQPAVNDTTDVVFRVLIRGLQDAGLYEANIRYISVPIF